MSTSAIRRLPSGCKSIGKGLSAQNLNFAGLTDREMIILEDLPKYFACVRQVLLARKVLLETQDFFFKAELRIMKKRLKKPPAPFR